MFRDLDGWGRQTPLGIRRQTKQEAQDLAGLSERDAVGALPGNDVEDGTRMAAPSQVR